jgi:hypothetical protein
MKAIALPSLLVLSILAGCSGWPAAPFTYSPATVVPSSTPRIQTATPLVLSPTPQITPPTVETLTDTPAQTAFTPSDTPTTEASATPGAVAVDILGCDTGVDILHGMGEVTNAYVTIRNATGTDLNDLCATLRGLDEARPHPDKTKCVAALPAGYEVTFKLTVDTTYKQVTPIQVDVAAGESLVARVGEPACEAIGLLLPGEGEMGVVRPIPTP